MDHACSSGALTTDGLAAAGVHRGEEMHYPHLRAAVPFPDVTGAVSGDFRCSITFEQ
jgi:hypothetical protein